MPIAIACPDCGAKLKAPDTAAGKTLACPKCTARMVVPSGEDSDDEPARGDDRPRKRVRPRAEDDSDEVPRSRRRRDDDDGRPRPKRRKPAKSGGGVPVWASVVGGVGLLALMGTGAYLALGNKKDDGNNAGGGDKPGLGGLLGGQDKAGWGGAGVQGAAAVVAGGRTAPAGFTSVVDPDGGYEVFLPGEVGKVAHGENGRDLPRSEVAAWYSFNDMGELEVNVVGRNLRQNRGGTTEAALMAVLEELDHPPKPSAGTGTKRMVTLGGQPALEYRLNEDRLGQSNERFVFLVTVKGNKAYIVRSKTRSGKEPDQRHDQIVESFRFR